MSHANSSLRLVAPSLAYEAQILVYREESLAADQGRMNGVSGLDNLSVPEWLDLLERKKHDDTRPKGMVPDSTFLCLRLTDDHLVGMINIRHDLNEYLLNYGGHIGYSIRPRDRGQGYGKEQLRLGLQGMPQTGHQPRPSHLRALERRLTAGHHGPGRHL